MHTSRIRSPTRIADTIRFETGAAVISGVNGSISQLCGEAQGMKIGFEQQGTISKIALEGRLDAAGTAAIESQFSAHCASKPNVIVDLSKVGFLASIGIRLLVAGAQAQTKIGGKMVIMRPDEVARRILKTTGIDKLLPVYENERDAAAAFAAR
jgi:anti-anti-sigma factor